MRNNFKEVFIMENENIYTEFEEIEGGEEIMMETEERSGGFGKIAVVGGLAAIAGGVAFAWKKTKDKREQRQVEKLREKGYAVYEPRSFDEGEDVLLDEVETK